MVFCLLFLGVGWGWMVSAPLGHVNEEVCTSVSD